MHWREPKRIWPSSEYTETLRRKRNEYVKDRMLKGDTVAFRVDCECGDVGGDYPGEICTFEPIRDHGEIKVEDVVFCEVQHRFYAHFVKAIGDWNGRRYFKICNLQGCEHGWCFDEQVYGKRIWKFRQ